MKISELKPGTKVTCVKPVEAFLSGFGAQPITWFRPGMVATFVRYSLAEDRRECADFIEATFQDERRSIQRVVLLKNNIRLLD